MTTTLYYHIVGIYCEKEIFINHTILRSEEIFVIFEYYIDKKEETEIRYMTHHENIGLMCTYNLTTLWNLFHNFLPKHHLSSATSRATVGKLMQFT